MASSKKLFCFGFGYCAKALSALLAADGGWTIAASARTPEKCDVLRAAGIDAQLSDSPPDLSGVTHILLSAPPDAAGDPVFREHADVIARASSAVWVGYLSATSVYGDHNGAWINEETAVTPRSPRGQQRLMAERQWQSLDVPLHVFRLSGIYGPQRSAIDDLRAGTARRIDKPGHFFNRMHVTDIARTLMASMQAPQADDIYNLADDLPAPAADVVAEAARLLDMTPPPLEPFDAATLTPMRQSFYAENKRIRNDWLKQRLGLSLLYPTYREGLQKCL